MFTTPNIPSMWRTMIHQVVFLVSVWTMFAEQATSLWVPLSAEYMRKISLLACALLWDEPMLLL